MRIGGDELGNQIISCFKRDFGLDIGENTAEEVKIQLGSAWPLEHELAGDVGGRDSKTGLPRTTGVTSQQVRVMIDSSVVQIIDAIKATLERTPPELAADVISRGLVLAGGGALLAGMAERVTHEIGIQAVVADEPLFCVVNGAGMTLDNIDLLKGIAIQGDN